MCSVVGKSGTEEMAADSSTRKWGQKQTEDAQELKRAARRGASEQSTRWSDEQEAYFNNRTLSPGQLKNIINFNKSKMV